MQHISTRFGTAIERFTLIWHLNIVGTWSQGLERPEQENVANSKVKGNGHVAKNTEI
jgi:hypothetical protein